MAIPADILHSLIFVILCDYDDALMIQH